MWRVEVSENIPMDQIRHQGLAENEQTPQSPFPAALSALGPKEKEDSSPGAQLRKGPDFPMFLLECVGNGLLLPGACLSECRRGLQPRSPKTSPVQGLCHAPPSVDIRGCPWGPKGLWLHQDTATPSSFTFI